jgi:hypothetical protein
MNFQRDAASLVILPSLTFRWLEEVAFAQSGPLAVNNPIDPLPDESCGGGTRLNLLSPRALLPLDYHFPPAQFLDNEAGPEASDGRVKSVLRRYLQTCDAHKITRGPRRHTYVYA